MTPEDIEELKEFGRRIARLSPEQTERRRWARWIEKLRRREDPLAYETQEDSTEDRDNLYR
jgi:hypothetical protein